jgi:hypothetical protein
MSVQSRAGSSKAELMHGMQWGEQYEVQGHYVAGPTDSLPKYICNSSRSVDGPHLSELTVPLEMHFMRPVDSGSSRDYERGLNLQVRATKDQRARHSLFAKKKCKVTPAAFQFTGVHVAQCSRR